MQNATNIREELEGLPQFLTMISGMPMGPALALSIAWSLPDRARDIESGEEWRTDEIVSAADKDGRFVVETTDGREIEVFEMKADAPYGVDQEIRNAINAAKDFAGEQATALAYEGLAKLGLDIRE